MTTRLFDSVIIGFDGSAPITVGPHGFAQDPRASIGTIVAGFDGSPESRAALDVARSLARAMRNTPSPVPIVPRPAPDESDEQSA